MATETTLATAAGHDWRQAAISRAARHLYDAETALPTAQRGDRRTHARHPRLPALALPRGHQPQM